MTYKKWTPEEDAYLRTHYADSTPEELETHLGRSRSSIYQHAVSVGLKKSPQYFKTHVAGRFFKDGRHNGQRFAPGMTPWNKGKKGWVAPGSQATQFKPGGKPMQTMPVGSYRINQDGHLQRKIGEEPGGNHKRWRNVAELVWIAANGSLPPGHIVVFKRGMKTAVLEEITLDKVECISRAENARRNHARTDPDLIKLYQLKGAITRQVNRIIRETTP